MNLNGNFLDYFVVFWAGVLVSFTPCVYPVMPLTASFIAGINTKGSKMMGFVISLIYVFGLALTYCAIGAFAALTGKMFGQVQNNPIIFIGVANVLIFFALVMFDVIRLPNFGVSIQHKIKVKNIWTVVFFGMASGLVVGACTAPVLGGLLFYVASKQNIIHGISLLFVFSYGVGASLILVGTFSGILANLPKSGKWLVRVKQFCGLVLLIAAEYFLVKAGGLFL
ncbi:Cytochrome c-type biogenesis protein DsbD, protein-disulfide reductase [hydrothermal vent metagenome]|uniref:Cytochrome c-type biogenesis protein DsbD, protein-disulfide reductase n=1 Tax=hydrothermal vent metagenome TaxID=652676 RepID=A0A3B1CYZ2_9ZZZZ